MRRFHTADDGVAILELALIAPFLILLAIGIIEIGVYTRDAMEVGNAARAGVQYGAQSTATSNDAPGISAAAKSDANEVTGLNVTSNLFCACHKTPGTHVANCTPTPSCAKGDHFDMSISVTASNSFSALVSVPAIPSTITIARTATQLISP